MLTAVVLAAGLSTRMGRTKPLLPWGRHTVIEQILSVLGECPVDDVLVVTGHDQAALTRCLAGWPARIVFNPDYASGEMLSSLQAGLKAAPADADAALMVLGDQPALDPVVVGRLAAAYHAHRPLIVAPSYQMRRGHPFLIDRRFWGSILALGEGQTLRDLLRAAGPSIYYIEVAAPGVLEDMDTPDEYRRQLDGYLKAHPM